jgi:sigma-B regulation protein RsbU (phosphoserine phosphatase)
MNPSTVDLVRSIVDILINLINYVAILMMVVYVLTRTGAFSEVGREFSLKKKLLLVTLFGLLSIYGTVAGIKTFGVNANVRDLGPAVAGMTGGPLVGLGAGLLGGLHRYFRGGFTRCACALATVIAGFAGGVVRRFKQGELLSPLGAAGFGVAMESFHMLLLLALSRPFDQAVVATRQIAAPMIVANACGLALFVFMIRNYRREQEVAAAKERIESDLKVAHDIQVSMLPRIFPPFPERKEVTIFAAMEPAKEVGGDFFDLFFIDDRKLCFLVGDVSEKGVPAALFMVITKVLLKTEATQRGSASLGEVFYRVNNMLCPDNDACMFVTVFCAVLDVETGELEYANAGHNPPLLCRGGGAFEFVDVPSGVPLGVQENAPFVSHQMVLRPKDSILLYTDGVTEAMNPAGEQFSGPRLKRVLDENRDKTMKELIVSIKTEVSRFAGSAPQFDDITMVALEYHGRTGPS